MPSQHWPPLLRTTGLTCSGCWCGPDRTGMSAGAVAETLELAPNTLTFHFDRLRQAGLDHGSARRPFDDLCGAI